MISKSDIERRRLDLDFDAFRIAVERFRDAKTDAERHLFWGSILKFFRGTVNGLIRIADADPSTRNLASKMRSLKMKDTVVKYLFASRNTDDHSDEKGGILAAESVPGKVSVPGIIDVNYGSSSNGPYVSIVGCQVGDQLVDGSFYFDAGKPVFLPGRNLPVSHLKPGFKPNVAITKKGKRIAVPTKGDGREMSAVELCSYALDWLTSQLDEIERTKPNGREAS